MTMLALGIQTRPRPGELAERLVALELEAPVPGAKEVLVRTRASSIQIDDLHIAEGTFYGGVPIGARPSTSAPVVPGTDVSGEVVAVGARVTRARIGDRVFGIVRAGRRYGAWAELVTMDERMVALLPASVTYEAAAASALSGLVAHDAMRHVAPAPGRVVVVVGASGGIGAIAVRLAARAGATVIGVCSASSAEAAIEAGCSRTLDYRAGPWDAQLGPGDEVDVVLDLVGGEDVEAAARERLSSKGSFVTVVGPERFVGDRALGLGGALALLARVAARIAASRLKGPRYVLAGPTPGTIPSLLPEVLSGIVAGARSPIDSIVPFELDAMRAAIRRAAEHRNRGRIVVRFADGAPRSE